MLTRPRVLLHLEGAAILAVALFFYQQLHASWLLAARAATHRDQIKDLIE